ncbi:MAG: aldo/keto reductase [Clostridiales bacterium]|mgnify:CR=1 FL=1|jgi:aryl-alcohol dehydrogenase-like predicted oxidoreductase|nr:aldo/keto reductase [Clostridiales bacterium]
MLFRKLGSSDLNCSVVALGTWSMGGDFWGKSDDDASIETIRTGLDAGINTIDTAPVYGNGHSEEIVGKAIKGRKREDIIIATKCGIDIVGKTGRNSSPELLYKEIDASLKRLGTDYVDLYQVHWPDPNTPLEETFTALSKIVESGKVRYVGVSNYSPEQMEEASKYCDIVSLQPPYSLLQREIEDEILPYCIEKGIGVLSYGSIGAGALTGKFKTRPIFNDDDRRDKFYDFFSEENWPKTAALVDVLREIADSRGKPVVHVAINWVLKQEGITVALVGARTPEQAIMNAEAGEWSLSDEENKIINDAYKRIFG